MAKKILLVDDDHDLVDSMKSIVESGGYEVAVAYDGSECLEKVNEAKPDLIILDVMMPGKDGWEVCRELKDAPTTRDIPIIMLTAVGSQVRTTQYTHEGGMETEADDYFPKPVKPVDLMSRIKKLVG